MVALTDMPRLTTPRRPPLLGWVLDLLNDERGGERLAELEAVRASGQRATLARIPAQRAEIVRPGAGECRAALVIEGLDSAERTVVLLEALLQRRLHEPRRAAATRVLRAVRPERPAKGHGC